MRLQLIRYESVELTEQLMRERQGDSSESNPQNIQSGEEMEMGGLGTVSGETGMRKEAAEDCRTQENRESVFLLMTAGTSSETQSISEESVMLQLQDTAQQLGMQVV